MLRDARELLMELVPPSVQVAVRQVCAGCSIQHLQHRKTHLPWLMEAPALPADLPGNLDGGCTAKTMLPTGWPRAMGRVLNRSGD